MLVQTGGFMHCNLALGEKKTEPEPDLMMCYRLALPHVFLNPRFSDSYAWIYRGE